jgi:hypothetical protein
MMKENDKSNWIAVAIFSVVILFGGLYGIHEQGEFWGRDIGADGAHGWEIALAFALPSATIVVGALGIAWVLLASPVALTFSTRQKGVAIAVFCFVVVASIVALSHHAATVADQFRNERRERHLTRQNSAMKPEPQQQGGGYSPPAARPSKPTP